MSATRVRDRSALRVLDYLWREGPANRVDVIRATELSRATVSKLVGELQAQGLVDEHRGTTAEGGRSGRPPSLLALNPRIGALGGVDFDHSSVRVAIADLSGELLLESRTELDVDNEAERAISLAVDGIRGLLRRAGLARSRLLGVGVAVSGPVLRDSGNLSAAGILPGWTTISLERELERRLRVAVHMGNDANLGALAEVRAGAAQGASNVVYLMLSSGVGGGLVLDGSLFTGHSGMTGELGHVPVDLEGELCRCGNRGCLETVAGARRLLATLAPVHGPGLTVERAAELACSGDVACRAAFRDAGLAAGRVAGAICNVVNPELVIVGGDLIAAGDVLVDAVREGLDRTALPAVGSDVRVIAATLGDRAQLLGAVGLAITEADITALTTAA